MNELISLNGEDYLLGKDKAISVGFDMKNNPVIAKSVIHSNPDGSFYITSYGIQVKVADLSVFYLDTPSNRAKLRANLRAYIR